MNPGINCGKGFKTYEYRHVKTWKNLQIVSSSSEALEFTSHGVWSEALAEEGAPWSKHLRCNYFGFNSLKRTLRNKIFR